MPKLGSSSTALEALQGADLSGKVAIVTGGNSGIGVETVRALATAGAKVVLCSRDVAAGEKVAEDIKKAPELKGSIEVRQLDLADLKNVKDFAEQHLKTGENVDMLILNAGVMACPLTRTAQGLEMQFGVNHVAHFLLTSLLLDKMKAQSSRSRVVAVSSSAHAIPGFDLKDLNYDSRPYSAWGAYGQSKLCNILFARELAERCKGTPVTAYSLHPGVINTNLQRHMGAMGSVFRFIGKFFNKTVEQGAATTVFTAVTLGLEEQSGKFFIDCQLRFPRLPKDEEAGEKLWEATEKLIAEKLK